MELIDIPLNYFLAGFGLWVVTFIWFAKRPEWIAASLLVVFFFMQVITDSVLDGRFIPMGQIIVLLFLPPLFVALSFRQTRVVWNDLFLIGVYSLCILASIVLNDLSLWEYKAALLPMIFMLFVYLSIDSAKALQRVLYVYIALIVINTTIAGLQASGYEWAYPDAHSHRADAGGFTRGFGLVGHFTKASLYAAVAIPVATAMFIRARRQSTTILAFVFGMFALAGQVLSVNRSAVAGIALGLWVVLKRGFDLRTIVAGFIAVSFAAIVIVMNPLTRAAGENLVEHFSAVVSDDVPLDKSAASRPRLRQMGLKTWQENPIFGGGPTAVGRNYGRDPHNMIVSVMAQYGVVGLVVFGLILLRCYLQTLRASRMGYRTEGTALGGALVVTLPIGMFHSVDQMDMFWFVPALCLALARFPDVQRQVPRQQEMHAVEPYLLAR